MTPAARTSNGWRPGKKSREKSLRSAIDGGQDGPRSESVRQGLEFDRVSLGHPCPIMNNGHPLREPHNWSRWCDSTSGKLFLAGGGPGKVSTTPPCRRSEAIGRAHAVFFLFLFFWDLDGGGVAMIVDGNAAADGAGTPQLQKRKPRKTTRRARPRTIGEEKMAGAKYVATGARRN